ncbi:MAG: hypothetical protein FJ098_17380 [Deltaproteobacteria bacterium]|nr:hypothetical protein [Deltaproteobacteria bacterium]
MRPDAFELFLRYHLGLDAELRPRFYNLAGLAREYGVDRPVAEGWLRDARLSADVTGHVDFRLAEAHGEIQLLALTAPRQEVLAFARRCFQGYQAALGTYDPARFRHGTDWDDLWGDKAE